MADEERKENENDERDEKDADEKSDSLGDAGKRALDAERKRARAAERELKELRTKVKDAEDKDKSELERLQDRIAQAEKRAENAEGKVDRYEVAAAKGLTPAQAKRLVGSTREELEDDADAMRSELGLDKDESDDESKDDKDEAKDEGIGRPKENLRAGASNEDDDEAEISVSGPLLKKYKATLAAFVDQARRFCSQRGMTYMLTRSDQGADVLVSQYLRERGLVR